MRSSWLPLTVVTALALAAGSCTKDAQSREISPQAQAQPAGDLVAATPVAVDRAVPGAAIPGTTGPGAAIPGTASPGAPVPAGENAVGGDKSYTLKVESPDSVARGASGVVRVTVVPAKGWKMNKDFPTRLTISPPEGVAVAKKEQRVKDAVSFEDKAAVFAVNFTAESAGDKSFKADFRFAVCTETTCDPKKAALAWNVQVK